MYLFHPGEFLALAYQMPCWFDAFLSWLQLYYC